MDGIIERKQRIWANKSDVDVTNTDYNEIFVDFDAARFAMKNVVSRAELPPKHVTYERSQLLGVVTSSPQTCLWRQFKRNSVSIKTPRGIPKFKKKGRIFSL